MVKNLWELRVLLLAFNFFLRNFNSRTLCSNQLKILDN
jgi:hypothetical protein